MSVSVSIVMPVYNGSKYIRKAIDSIVSQDMSDWELLVVDDGSTDETPQILDEYQKIDARIKVYHNVNHGVSFSRQFGIDRAVGKYCIHVDADDWVEPNYLSALFQKAEETNADMVWCDCFCNEKDEWKMSCSENPNEMIRAILLQKHWGTLWNRLIKTSICQKKDVVFPSCSMWEDMSFLVQTLFYCKKIEYLPSSLYHYRQIDTSLTHLQSTKDISAEYRKAIITIEKSLFQHNEIEKYQYELRGIKLFAIRDFIDDLRFRDYDKFMNTYPDAIDHINEYKHYPKRLKICAWLLRHNCPRLIPAVCKVDGLFRRLGLSSQV